MEKNCQKCGEQLEQCEACGIIGCVVCYGEWRMDGEGAWYCPKCVGEWNRMTENGMKTCANCTHFIESDEEYGVCGKENIEGCSGYYCEKWKLR